ncbi:MAG TPA: hybrid sensor histidine kinase/response regulator [Gemmatimonadaceae bacterium]|nr:hybrid sensor histidine kinase/response regulator [Gemmatimonadaceae bacterium]
MSLDNGLASILLVDDRVENLIALEAILEPLGVEIDRATSGEEALRRLLAKEYACIVLDVQMPGMNGFETARFIKSRDRTKHLPIIFLTAISKEERYVFEGYAVGAVDYLFKPFEPEILRSKVSVFVDLHRKTRQLERQAMQLRDAERHTLELKHATELAAHEAYSAEQLRTVNEQLMAANEELRERQAELERAMGARSRFYASMSHELRTPINAVLGYTTLMLDEIYGPLTTRQAESLRRVEKAAKHLLELVNDVLDLSKIEAGRIELHVEPVHFPGLIEDLFISVSPLADEHGVELSCRHEGAAHRVATDPRRVRQIVLNLLSNAIKFGEGKPVEVLTAALPDGGVEICVRDHGVGIAPEHVSRIFEEFVQLVRSDDKGTGLGLPISRRLTELLGGSLSVESVPGRGSTFRLALPASIQDGREEHRARDDRHGHKPAPDDVRPTGDSAESRGDRFAGNQVPESRVL